MKAACPKDSAASQTQKTLPRASSHVAGSGSQPGASRAASSTAPVPAEGASMALSETLRGEIEASAGLAIEGEPFDIRYGEDGNLRELFAEPEPAAGAPTPWPTTTPGPRPTS